MATEHPTIRISTEGSSRAEVIVLLFQTFRDLDWGVEHLHPMRMVAKTPATGFAKGEDIVIELDDQGFTALSKPSEWSPLAKKKRHQVNIDRLAEAFAQVRIKTTPDMMAADLKELDESGVMQLDESTAHANEFHWKDIGSLILPRRDFWATPLLLDLSVLVYILMVATGVHFMSPSGEDLLTWGGNYRPSTVAGEWWRLLTCCFVHIGVVHLLFNMYALLMVGIQLEPLLGSRRVMSLYIITGVFASMASLWWHENTVSAGASGAIFGLYGVFLALLTTDLIQKEVRQQLLSSIGIFVVYNLIYGLKGGVDNAAHIGGLLSGVLLGFALYPALRRPEANGVQLASFALPVVLLAAAGAWALKDMPADDHHFEASLEEFFRLEEEGLAMFRLDESSTGEHQLVVLDVRSAPAWDSALVVLENTLELDLSANTAFRRDRLLDYARERVINTQLIREALTESSPELESAIDRSMARIDSMISDMGGD